jgi:hypothetical protein
MLGNPWLREGKVMTNEITWGDTVLVSLEAPAEFRPGARGSVSGIRDLKRTPESDSVDSAALYLIEFADGEEIEIPQSFLLKDIEDHS